VRVNRIGESKVRAYFSERGFLGLLVIPGQSARVVREAERLQRLPRLERGDHPETGSGEATMKSINELTRDDIELALNDHGNELSPRSMIVIKMLYGLTRDGRKYSSEEIAQQTSVARVRILQVQKLALTQLKLIAPESQQ
jgi:hypothetical protein